MKFLTDKIRYYWKSAKDFCIYKILHADDPPHRLALGVAVGMFVALTPTIGFQMMLSVFLAWLLRANKLVGVPLVWITNPATMIPIFYFCYHLGCKVLGEEVVTQKWQELDQQWKQLLSDPATTSRMKVRFWWEGLMDVITPLCVGSLIVATVLAVVSYYVSLYAIRSYRLRRWGQLMPPSLTPVDETNAVHQRPANEGENAA